MNPLKQIALIVVSACFVFSCETSQNQVASTQMSNEAPQDVGNYDFGFYDSIAYETYQEFLQNAHMENLEKIPRKDTVYRLFLLNHYGSSAQSYTFRVKGQKLKLVFEGFMKTSENESQKFERTFPFTDKLFERNAEIGYATILSKELDNKESIDFLGKLQEINLCELQQVKSERTGIVVHRKNYFFESLINGEHCIVKRSDMEEIEEPFQEFIYKISDYMYAIQ